MEKDLKLDSQKVNWLYTEKISQFYFGQNLLHKFSHR